MKDRTLIVVALILLILIAVVAVGRADALPYLNTPGDLQNQNTLRVVNNYGSQLETYNPQGSK